MFPSGELGLRKNPFGGYLPVFQLVDNSLGGFPANIVKVFLDRRQRNVMVLRKQSLSKPVIVISCGTLLLPGNGSAKWQHVYRYRSTYYGLQAFVSSGSLNRATGVAKQIGTSVGQQVA